MEAPDYLDADDPAGTCLTCTGGCLLYALAEVGLTLIVILVIALTKA